MKCNRILQAFPSGQNLGLKAKFGVKIELYNCALKFKKEIRQKNLEILKPCTD